MRRRFRVALLASFAGWMAVFFWLGAQSDPFWRGYRLRGRGDDYYSMLVEGFRAGHLSLNAEVSPDLLSSDSRVSQRAPFLLDAALYHGRYYLYYGVVPAALLLYPYARITGGELSLEAACLLFVGLGLGFGCCWLDRLRKRLAADWGAGFAVVAASLLATVPATPFLLRRAAMYELPGAAGYACMMGFWLALWLSWAERRGPGWTAAAGACAALAVGCRPNLFLVGLAGVTFLWGGRTRFLPGGLRDWIAALGPAAAVGGGLAWYNEARFGAPWDFGFSHGLNKFFSSGHPLFSPTFLGSNARWYLFSPPRLLPVFPFVFPSTVAHVPMGYSDTEDMYGFLPVTLVAALFLVASLAAPRPRLRPDDGGRRAWLMALVAAAGLEMAFTFLLGIRACRYAADFLTPLSILLVIGLPGFWNSRLNKAVVSCLAVAISLQTLLGAVQLFNGFQYSRPREFAFWSSLFNPSEKALRELGAPPPGVVRLTVRFLRPPRPVIAPLITTGIQTAFDSFQVTVLPSGYISLQILHGGYGGPRTGLIPVTWGRSYQLETSMGSLYPPSDDPYFSGAAAGAPARLTSLGWAALDGRTMIERTMEFYASSPMTRTVGAPSVAASGADAAEFVHIEGYSPGGRLPPMIAAAPPGSPAIYRLQLRPAAVSRPLPLLCSGITGKGDLLALEPLPDGRWRLIIDEWGSGLLAGPPFGMDQTGALVLNVVVGPALACDSGVAGLLSKTGATSLRDRLLAWRDDGPPVGAFQLSHHLDTFNQLVLGTNDSGFSSAPADFAGELRNLPLSAAQRREMLGRAVRLATSPRP